MKLLLNMNTLISTVKGTSNVLTVKDKDTYTGTGSLNYIFSPGYTTVEEAIEDHFKSTDFRLHHFLEDEKFALLTRQHTVFNLVDFSSGTVHSDITFNADGTKRVRHRFTAPNRPTSYIKEDVSHNEVVRRLLQTLGVL